MLQTMQMKLFQGVLALGAVAALASSSLADGRNPGSLLLYPEFDSGNGRNTLLTVTNTRVDRSVVVHFKYVSGQNDTTRCTIANVWETLTPGDTITVLTGSHNPGPFTKGYVYIYAVTAVGQNGKAVSYNYLAGDVVQLGGDRAFDYAINPLPFRAVPFLDELTDLENGGVGDGIRDLDGLEYEAAPDRILVPRFFGQATPDSIGANSDVVLVALSGGKQFETIVSLLLYNDNEEIFSGEHLFRCWERIPLLQLSAAFANDFLKTGTNQNPAESVLGLETGWFQLDGLVANSLSTTIIDPAILAVLIERNGPTTGTFTRSSELPFLNGKQTNGDLLPQTNNGEQ
jgi:hypothetical protein